jgi:uncharacterized protein
MSTDSSQPEPDDMEITGPTPDAPTEPEPFLAEVDDDEHVVAAELVELEEPERLRLRFRRPTPPPTPGPPHPGFWWAILWCLLMLIVAQAMPAVLVSVVVIVGEMILQIGQKGAGGQDLASSKDLMNMILLPTVLLSQLTLIVFSVAVLRLVAGKSWHRQVALRLPAVWHVVLAVLLWPALAFSSSAVYLGAKHLPDISHILSYFVAVFGMLAVVSAVWGLVRLITGRDWVRVLVRQPPLVQLVLAPLECLAAAGVGALIFQLVDPYMPSFDLLNTTGFMEDMVTQFRKWPPYAAVLIIGLGPGLGEELWCRAFLGRGLVGGHGVVMGVILTSLFFGAIHGDPHQGTMAAVMGLALHFTYLTTRSLWIPMLLHFLNNSLSVIADKLPEAFRVRLENIDTNPEGISWKVLAASACLLAAVGWAMYASRGRMVRIDGSDQPPWQPAYPGVAHPPANSGTAVAYPWPGLLPTLAVIAAVVGMGYVFCWG